MHWLWIAVLALVVGYLQTYVGKFITAQIPASQTQNVWVTTFANGVGILIAIFVAVMILSMVAGRKVVSA